MRASWASSKRLMIIAALCVCAGSHVSAESFGSPNVSWSGNKVRVEAKTDLSEGSSAMIAISGRTDADKGIRGEFFGSVCRYYDEIMSRLYTFEFGPRHARMRSCHPSLATIRTNNNSKEFSPGPAGTHQGMGRHFPSPNSIARSVAARLVDFFSNPVRLGAPDQERKWTSDVFPVSPLEGVSSFFQETTR